MRCTVLALYLYGPVGTNSITRLLSLLPKQFLGTHLDWVDPPAMALCLPSVLLTLLANNKASLVDNDLEV